MDEQAFEAQEIDGEIVEEKERPKATLREVRFASFVNQGMDPLKASQKVAPVNANNGFLGDAKKTEKQAAKLLKACQEKMLIDLSGLAPLAMQKLASLLDAKEKVFFQGEEVGEKPALETQRKVATQLVTWAQPKEKETTPSLFAAVVRFTEE